MYFLCHHKLYIIKLTRCHIFDALKKKLLVLVVMVPLLVYSCLMRLLDVNKIEVFLLNGVDIIEIETHQQST